MNLILLFLIPFLSFANLTKEVQFKHSLNGIIANATKADVIAGMVVASPSKSNPDYYYDWVRDTALTYSALIDYYSLSRDTKILGMIKNWVKSEKSRQNMWSLSGLGEPKYNVDGTSFEGPWGRPQNDGPALRAVAMIKFARIMLAANETDYVIKNLYHSVLPADSIIKKDLEYTAHHWHEASFDLWEEEKGMHFYTLLAQYTALKEGAILARDFSDHGASKFYQAEAVKIKNYLLNHFYDQKIGIKATIHKVNGGLHDKVSNIDIAVLLGLLHTYPFQDIYSFDNKYVVHYVNTIIAAFKETYTINKTSAGVALGRYTEDRYDGYTTGGKGNPWFLATAALAEYYCHYQKIAHVNLSKEIQNQFDLILYHSDRNGHLSEQFNRDTGFMQGAYDLTWSYSSFITAMMKCGF